MLEFAESVFKEVRKLEKDTETMILSGVSDMERYKFLAGRLEGIRLVNEIIHNKLEKYEDT
tara:strand:+ start:2586 stop:2768 length:183 start_codon:yes stop_codon:yes gene_type:complete